MKTLKSVLLAGAVAFAGTSVAQTKELQISTWLPPTHSLHKQMEQWGKEIEEETGGSLEINIYPSSQMGAAQDHYDMVRDGIVEMSIAAPTLSTGRFPIWSLVEIPFTFANTTTGARAFHEWYLEFKEQEMPEVMLCMTTVHHPGALNFNKPNIRVPADMKGVRMRPSGATTSEWMVDMGATVVPSSLPEVKELADRGAIDGVALPWDMVLFGVHTAMPYHIDEPFYVGAQAWIINKDFYDGLTEVEKAAIDKRCGPEWSEKLSAVWYDNMREFREQLVNDSSQHIYQLNAEERQLWIDSAKPVAEKAFEAVARRGFSDGAGTFDKLRAKLKEHGALVE